MLWVVATILAAAAQTARNAMQNSLAGTLGTLGATQVRFIYGLPFAVLFLVTLALLTRTTVPTPTATFVAFTAGGAVAQILGTALQLAAMRTRALSVVVAFSKTEPVQVAVFGLLILGEHLTPLRSVAIVIATCGVVLVAVKPGVRWDTTSLRPALLGVASGSFFAIAAVGFRGGIVSLPEGSYFVRAATTLVWSLAVQASLLGTLLAVFARAALMGSFKLWRRSLFAGFMGATASQFWFIGLSLTAAANVRTLGLVEMLFAQAVARRVFDQRLTAREAIGLSTVVAGVALLMLGI